MTKKNEGWWKVFDLIVDQLRSDDSRTAADGILQSVVAHVRGAAAIFTRNDENQLSLVASRFIDQDSLDAVRMVWEASGVDLEQGEERIIQSISAPWNVPPLVRAFEGNGALGFFPVRSRRTLGLLYVEFGTPPAAETVDFVRRLARMSTVVLRAPAPPAPLVEEAYLEQTPTDDFERARMLLLLDRNEWNLARVARLMGVTRRTVYLRLQRYSIPRQKIRKTTTRKA